LKELAVLTPKDPTVFRNLYEISLKTGDKKDAAENLQKYLAVDPESANAYRNLGDLLYEQKDFDGAVVAYRNASKLSQNLKGFYRNYIDILLQKKLDVEAVAVIQHAIKIQEANFTAFWALGDIYKKKEKYTEAARMYQEALKLDPKHLDAMTSLAECQARTGDVKNALLSYEQIVLMKQKPVKEYKVLGELQLKTGKTDNAMESFQKYLAEAPSDQEAAKTVGIYKHDQKKYKDAIGYLEMVKNNTLQTVDYLVALGDSYYQTGQTKKAAEIYALAWAARPTGATLRNVLKTLSDCYMKTGDQSNALKVFDAYTKLPGVQDREASYLCGLLREKTDRPAAIKVYLENTRLFPKDYRNFLQAGLLLSMDSMSIGKAAEMLKTASMLVDSIPILWEKLAQAYGKLSNVDSELQALQKLLTLQPQNIEANKRASMILIKRKQATQAIVYLETVLMHSPNDVPIMLMLADGYRETKRAEQALELLVKAKNIEPKNLEVRNRLYEIYKQSGQGQKALTEAKELIEQTNENKYRILYVQDLIAVKNYDEALTVLTNIRTAEPTNIDGLMLRAAILKAQKQYEQAIETYKDISYINENHVASLYERADAYLILAKYGNAEKFFTKVLTLNPKHALAELGLALVNKAQKNMTAYQEHLTKAKTLDPKNPLIMQEDAVKTGEEPAPKEKKK
jgi:tetratricopeptide (TPR) repeat protein